MVPTYIYNDGDIQLSYQRKYYTSVDRWFKIILTQLDAGENSTPVQFKLVMNEQVDEKPKQFDIDLTIEYNDKTNSYDISYGQDNGSQTLLCRYQLIKSADLFKFIIEKDTDSSTLERYLKIVDQHNLSGIKDTKDESRSKIYEFINAPNNILFVKRLSYIMIIIYKNKQFESNPDAVAKAKDEAATEAAVRAVARDNTAAAEAKVIDKARKDDINKADALAKAATLARTNADSAFFDGYDPNDPNRQRRPF
jgi:hypothetical protein